MSRIISCIYIYTLFFTVSSDGRRFSKKRCQWMTRLIRTDEFLADEEAIQKLCSNYIDNVKAYTQREKVRNTYTGQFEDPDERLLRAIEEKIDIPESRKDDFRREIMNYIGALAVDNKQFDYTTNARLQKALEMKLFEDKKDTIKLTSLVSDVVDRDSQAKIDVVKTRLIEQYGYNEDSATDVLNYVASIFARGDSKGQE